MKSVRKSFSALCCRLSCACLVSLPALAAAAGMSVSQLRCEYRPDPFGIDTPQPRLSWAVESEQRSVKQAAYQILVASTGALVAKDQADLWDSGKVTSDLSSQVIYTGKPLQSRQFCFWKVKVWTDAGESATSKPTVWTMGLLNPGDWQAKWIGSPTATAVEPVPLLRKTFSIDKPILSAIAYVSGLGYYELSINGKKVGTHELDPKFTR